MPKFTLPRPPKTDFAAPFRKWLDKTIERLERRISKIRPASGWKYLQPAMHFVDMSATNPPTYTGTFGLLTAASGVDTDLGGYTFIIPTDASFDLAGDDGTVKTMTIYPCITWYSIGTSAQVARFKLTYLYGNVNAVRTAVNRTLTIEQTTSTTTLTGYETMPSDANALTLTDLEPGSYITCYLEREGSHANDTYTNLVVFGSFTLKYFSDGQLINERVVNETSGQLRWTKRQTLT